MGGTGSPSRSGRLPEPISPQNDLFKEKPNETNSQREVAGRFEEWYRGHFNRQRNAFQHSVLIPHPVRKWQGHQSRRTPGGRARRLLHHGPLRPARRRRSQGREPGNHLHHQSGTEGWRFRNHLEPSGIEGRRSRRQQGGVRYGRACRQDRMPRIQAFQHHYHARRAVERRELTDPLYSSSVPRYSMSLSENVHFTSKGPILVMNKASLSPGIRASMREK